MAWPLWNRIVSLFLNSNTIPIPHGSSVWELEEDGSTLYLDSAGKTKKTFIFVKPSQARSNQGTMPGDVLFDGKMVGDEYDGTAYVVQGKCKGHYHANGPDGEGATTVVLRGKAPVFAATATNCQPLEGRDRDVTLTLQYRFRQ